MATNPIVEFRLANSLSQEALARMAGITRLAVMRTEQGIFSRIPPALISALLSKVMVTQEGDALTSDEEINLAYHKFQREVRRANYGALTETLPEEIRGVSPLIHWRLKSGLASQMGLCRKFCIHPASVAQFESGLQKKLPDQVLEALLEAGYDEDTLQKLQARQLTYIEARMKKKVAGDYDDVFTPGV